MGNENFEGLVAEITKINPKAGKIIRESEKYGFQLALYAEREWPDIPDDLDDLRTAMVSLAALVLAANAG